MRGFSDAYGSWKTICSSRRSPRISLGCRRWMTSVPRYSTDPQVAGSSRSRSRAGRRLPAPRLAHHARASRRRRSRSSGRRRRGPARPARRSSPSRIGKCLTRSRTSQDRLAVGRLSSPPACGLSVECRRRRHGRRVLDHLGHRLEVLDVGVAQASRRSGTQTGGRGSPSAAPGGISVAHGSGSWRNSQRGMERAAGRHVDQRRRLALDAVEAHALGVLVEPRQRRQQPERVRDGAVS